MMNTNIILQKMQSCNIRNLRVETILSHKFFVVKEYC